jgi:hypothetical protein
MDFVRARRTSTGTVRRMSILKLGARVWRNPIALIVASSTVAPGSSLASGNGLELRFSIVQLTPPGAIGAEVVSITESFEAGISYFGGYAGVQPGFWRGSSTSWVNCKPEGSGDVQVRHAAGQQMVGFAYFSFFPGMSAILWQLSGAGATWTSLNPPGCAFAGAKATDGVSQVGWALVGNERRAVVWFGSAQSMIDITPDIACDSYCGVRAGLECVRGTQQGGWIVGPNPYDGSFYEQAAIWSGSAESFVKLHPASAYRSIVFGTTGSVQGGYAQYPVPDSNWTVLRATMWRGSLETMTDLHPIAGEFSFSQVLCVDGDFQGGFYGNDVRTFQTRACIWRGDRTLFADLHPCGYLSSAIRSLVVLPSGVIRAVGEGSISETGARIPLMWEISPGARSCCGDLGPIDGVIDGSDLGTLLSHWGEFGAGTASDTNHDGLVDGGDLGFLLANWGPCPN